MGRVHRHADGTSHEHDDGEVHPPRRRRSQRIRRDGANRIAVLERILDENDRVAAANRRYGPMECERSI